MTTVGHVMILASAGSGKTYALTNRFVRLLALGAKPERIVALTFTRKAAGEFFDEILNKLARAASEPGYAAQLAGEIGVPAFGAADFLKLLRAVADAMHRLRLGTFDGFFARVARNFPLELGLAGEFEILQEHAARMERGRVLQRLFGRAGELAGAQREFIEAFKRATFGADEKRLGAQLDRFIDEHQEIFLAAPGRDHWGNPARIWREGWEGLKAAAQLAPAAQALRAALADVALSAGQRARWDAFFADLAGWSPGAPMGAALNYLFGNALKAWPGLAEIMVERKKHALPAVAGDALRRLLQAIIGAEFGRRLEMTRGIYAVLNGYEAVYHDAVRRAGKLTFGDVQRLLAPGEDGARTLSREAAEGNRLFIDFRLDAEIDHWLLDEFQDTSFGQWSVLKNLIDEAVQDAAGARSFFYVGDVKQSVFAWRGGDPRLFREIFNHYNDARPGIIAEEHLLKSWRSGPPVVAMVNAVFRAAPAIGELFPGEASAAWNREWRDHESARPQLGGHAALLHAADEDARFATALKLLHEIEPLERGLTCALLVQKNNTAAELAEYLRREGGVPAVAESDLHVCVDNPLGTALLALVKAAAHPGDTLAHGHLRMTPLGDLLVAEGLAEPERLTRRLLGQIHAEGFERTMDFWLRRLEPRLAADDAFSRARGRQFIAAAGLFDATASRGIAEFIQFMESYTVRDAEAAAVVRVMTIHKAKGLGFDVVILPDLEGTKLDARRKGLAVQRAPDRSVEWVLDLPDRLFAEQDTVLAAHLRAAEADACYENLSLLYVAMTRAKRAMYVITKPPGKSASRNFPKLLAEALGGESATVRVGKQEFAGAFSEGDADWHTRIAPPTPEVRGAPEIGRLDPATVGKSQRLPSRQPSDEKTGLLGGAQLFALTGGGSAAADFGDALHRLFAEVEWASDPAMEKIAALWSGCGVAGEEALACLRAPELAGVWTRPEGATEAEVWRERAFEVVLDGAWVTGVFDRVVVERDGKGIARRATVFDFKTDRIGDEREVAATVLRYAGQLNLYRKVAAVLLELKREAVTCELVLAKMHRRVVVPVTGSR
ncbi:MAG TPA: UvrD-helicase domain-containing protein [Opitutaceae bacterium]|nr:UvrD-helicase domain-containing protein [Opitutaceae bacterium]